MSYSMDPEDCDCEDRHISGRRHMHMHMGMGILPMLVIPLVVMMAFKMSRRMAWRMRMMQREEWKNGVPPMFAELHRRAHAAEAAAAREAEQPAETQI